MKLLAVLGASGHGKVVADSAELAGWEKVIFFDDAWPTYSQNDCWLIAGDTRNLVARKEEFQGIVVAIGHNQTRLEKLELLASHGCRLVSIVHPSAQISRYAVLGTGTVVMAGAVVNAGASIGEGCIVNTGSTIDHDCRLSRGVHISPGVHLAGGVGIGECSWIGIGASVRQLVQIGRDVVIGAGAAVVKDIPDNCTAVGVPARVSGH